MITVLFFLLAFISAESAVVPLIRASSLNRVYGSYIVVFKSDSKQSNIESYKAETILKGINLKPFEIGRFQGVFVKMTQNQLDEQILQYSDVIDYIEENQKQTIAGCSNQQNAQWNLERLCERTIDLGNLMGYTYDTTAGWGVTSYIIDTGVYISHSDFGGRASWGTNTVDDINDDCDGHGTHVAGTVAGTIYGVAKKTKIVAVKVLDCNGEGTTTSLLHGIQWVSKNAKKPANANLSLISSNSRSIISAVESVINQGIPFVVVAGNFNTDACQYSPSNVPNAITVGSTTILGPPRSKQLDARSIFSNYGSCVDIFAPGEMITAPWIGNTTATRTISGTSMASPHVCGAVSLIQGDFPNYTPDQITEMLKKDATSGVIDLQCGTTKECKKTTNTMLRTTSCGVAWKHF